MVKLDSNLSQINKNWQVLNQLVVKNVSLENNSEIEFAANLNTVNANSDELSEEVRELVATISDAFVKMSEDEQMVFIQFLIANADENITVELENNPDISSEELVNLQTTKETLQNLFTDFKNLYNELVKLNTDGNTPFVSVSAENSADSSPELATASGSTASVSADVTQSGNYSSVSPAEVANGSVPISSSSEFISATADAANFVSNTSSVIFTATSTATELSHDIDTSSATNMVQAKAADSDTGTATEYNPASNTSSSVNVAKSNIANFVNNVTVENNVAVPEDVSVATAQTTTPIEVSPMLTAAFPSVGSPLAAVPTATSSSPATEATAPAPNLAAGAGSMPLLGASGGSLLLFDNTINGLDFGTISGPTICYVVILMMMTGPLTRVMNNYSGQLTELGEEGDIVNDALNDFLTPIATWAAQNSSQITAAGGINLFDAFYVWLSQNNPSSPYLGSDSVTSSQIDEQFANSGSLSGVFELMYTAIGDINNKLNGMFGTTGKVYLNVATMVASGDTAAYTSGTILTSDNVAGYGQQLLMTLLTEPANSAGYAINGITSNPIFSNSWTQAGNAQTGTWAPDSNPPFTPSSSSASSLFYNLAASGTPKYEFFLTLPGISQFIGNSNQNSGSSTNTGAISACLKSQTTVGTTNALLQGMLNLYSTTYSNYVSSLGNIIPALSIKG